MATLSDADIATAMQELSGWTRAGQTLHKRFVFEGFPQAVAFVSRLVPGAEAADHHPDIVINYKRVTVTYTTHSEGGLTTKDFAGAKMAERVSVS